MSLGKANIVALTKSGEVYTFGMNNKGQCGRDFPGASRDLTSAPSSAGQVADDANDGASDSEDAGAGAVVGSAPGGHQALFSICGRDKHTWKHDQCMVCVLCAECTGYGPGCVSSGRPDRNPGMLCGCGSGDSGCSKCGICIACAGEDEEVLELPDGGAVGAVGGVGTGGEAAFGAAAAAAAAAAAGLPPGDLPLEAFAAAFGQGAQVIR